MASTLTQELYSQNHWLADGVDTIWNFTFAGGYLDRSHVKAYSQAPLAGDITPIVVTAGMFITDFSIQITPAVTAGHTLVIYRETPKDEPLVNFLDGARITEQALDTAARQSVLIGAEVTDFFAVGSVGGLVQLAADLQGARDTAVAAIATVNADAVAAAASAVLSSEWATKLVTPVAGGEYSSKYHAQASAASAVAANQSHVWAADERALAADWATKLVDPVAGGEYSSKFHAQAAATSASAASAFAVLADADAATALDNAGFAATSASNAAGSASTASTAASNAAGSAATATTAASNAAGSQAAAAASAVEADASADLAASYAGQSGTASFRNKFINGDFRIWQRGVSIVVTGASGLYTADRYVSWPGTGGTCTVSRQFFAPGVTPDPSEPESFMRHDQTVGGTGPFFLAQRIEGVRVGAGRAVTRSVWLKSSVAITATPVFSQVFDGSANVDTNATAINITTSWQKFTITVTLPGITGKTIGANNCLTCYFVGPSATVFALDATLDQFEIGSVATPFEHRYYGTEFALCQRYYEVVNYPAFYMPGVAAATTIYVPVYFKATKRTFPTIVMPTSTNACYNSAGSSVTPTGWSGTGILDGVRIEATHASGLGGVVGQALTASAEL